MVIGEGGEDAALEVAPGVQLGEVLATFRSIMAIQERFGEEACRRFVVSDRATGAGEPVDTDAA